MMKRYCMGGPSLYNISSIGKNLGIFLRYFDMTLNTKYFQLADMPFIFYVFILHVLALILFLTLAHKVLLSSGS